MRQACLPVGCDLTVCGNRVDVVGEGKSDDVRSEAVDHRTGLLARAAMRLLHGYGLAGLFLPVFGEQRVVSVVKLARRIVGNVEQGGVGSRDNRREGEAQAEAGGNEQ